MNKIIHNKNLVQYEFLEELDRVTYNTSVFVWIEGKNAIMIDTGYYDHSLLIKDDLFNNDIKVDKIVVTHYHRDHAEGSIVFTGAQIIASSRYKDNFSKCENITGKNLTYPKPTILVQNELVFKFYTTEFKVIETPGHTPCGLSVLINDEYLYVSDMLLEDVNMKMILPYIDINSNPKDHIDTLNLYYDLKPKHLLLTHGKAKFNIEVSNYLDDRLYYLNEFVKNGFKSHLESCLKLSVDKYSMTEIHKLNVRNAKKHMSTQLTSFN